MQRRLKIEKFAGIVILVIIGAVILQSAIIHQLIEVSFDKQQSQELSRYVSFVSQSLNDAFELTKDYETLQNENLYEKSKNIRARLSSNAAIDITAEELEALAHEFELDGMAILAPTEDDVIVLSSTFREEVGTSTSSWGYWYTAFRELVEGAPVSVDKGQAYDDFWVGPKSMSYYVKGYFRYGYIYQPDGHYLINIMVKDNELMAAKAAGTVNDTLKDIQVNVNYIDHIGVVNAEILKSYRGSDYENSGNDPLVMYGDIEHTGFTKVEYDVDDIMSSDTLFATDLKRNSQQLVLKRLNDKELLVIVTNSLHHDQVIRVMLMISIGLAVLAGIVILAVNFWMIRKYGAALHIQRKRLRMAEAFKNTIQSMPAMIYHCKLSDTGEIVLSYNDGKVFKQDEIVLQGDRPIRMAKIYSPEFMDVAEPYIKEAFSGSRARFEASFNGETFDVILSPVNESGVDEKTGLAREVIGFGTEISERVRRAQSAEYLASHDLLTGLPNRLSFNAILEKAIGHVDQAGIVYFDLDRFKAVNDTYGHQVGDEVLKVVADRFRLFTNDSVNIARVGGDEFVACLEDLSMDEINVLTERIISIISQPMEISDAVIRIGASAGISHYPDDGRSAEVLISKADKAMYESKVQGKSTFETA